MLTFVASLSGNELKTFPWVEKHQASDSEGASNIRTIEDCILHLVTPPSKTRYDRCALPGVIVVVIGSHNETVESLGANAIFNGSNI